LLILIHQVLKPVTFDRLALAYSGGMHAEFLITDLFTMQCNFEILSVNTTNTI